MTNHVANDPAEDPAARQAEQQKEERRARAKAADPDVPSPLAGSSPDDEDPET